MNVYHPCADSCVYFLHLYPYYVFTLSINVSDLPTIISRDIVAIIDPHKECIQDKTSSRAGDYASLSEFLEYKNHLETFESIFNFDKDQGTYDGTIFRFPLRRLDSNSEISNKPCQPKTIESDLFEPFKKESPYILLFLNNITKVSLMEWEDNTPKPRTTFVVERDSQLPNTCTDTTEVSVSLNCVSVRITATPATSATPATPVEHHWLVMLVKGTEDTELNKLETELKVLPRVGLASSLPVPVDVHLHKTAEGRTFGDCDTVKDIFDELDKELQKVLKVIKVDWLNSSPMSDISDVRTFCFLPLPMKNATPVHIHGYFAVADNRQSIKWPGDDDKSKEAEWNKMLVYKMVAPSYALLLACHTSLIHYIDTPLPLNITDSVTDAYSKWPLHAEVRNVPIWGELISPILRSSLSLPLLWTSAGGGKWVTFEEAYFLPESSTIGSPSNNSTVIQKLITLGIPIVNIPKMIYETIKQNEQMLAIISKNEISPLFVRDTFKEKDSCSTLSKTEAYDILNFVLSDLNDEISSLDGIRLLPLKGNAGLTVFQKPTIKKSDSKQSQEMLHCFKYMFPAKSKHLLDLVFGLEADSLIVDPELPVEISEKLCKIIRSGREALQLKEVDIEVMCKELLPMSLQCMKSEQTMPSQSWMDALWKWIAEEKVNLSKLEGLVIVPQLSFSNNTEERGVTLIQVDKAISMCQLSNYFNSPQKELLLRIVQKLNFLVVDEGKMNNCDGMKSHPDFEEYIPAFNSDVILRKLSKLDNGDRHQIIQNLASEEKDFLRRLFMQLWDYEMQYKDCLRSIPIYHASDSTSSSPYISLCGADEAFLPPDDISQLPVYPSSMLNPPASAEESSFLKALGVKQLSLSDLCTKHLLKLAREYIRLNSREWSAGDDLVLWILKQREPLSGVLKELSKYELVYARNTTHKKAQELYDPNDHALSNVLFDINTDTSYFPDERYFEERRCKQALKLMGMKSWSNYQGDDNEMRKLLIDRMNSVHTLSRDVQLKRGEFIVQTLAESSDKLLQDECLNGIRFLQAEVCPSSYPPWLKKIWFGKLENLYSIRDLCSPHSHNHNLVGTIRPILSKKYSVLYNEISFHKITKEDVINQLNKLQSEFVSNESTDKIDDIVMSVYAYLLENRYEKKLSSIWSKFAEKVPKFMSAKKFVVDLPSDFQRHDLEPFYYCLRDPIDKYGSLFQLHGPLTEHDVAAIVKDIYSQTKDRLTNTSVAPTDGTTLSEADTKRCSECLTGEQVSLCATILNWLGKIEYKNDDMLMLTKTCTLVPARECVFDDREWIKQDQKLKKHVEQKSFTFVHDEIHPKVAKHFQVKPLSQQIAHSQKLSLTYTEAGQHEDITQRIHNIVKDYGANIDVFKELLQNADDAGATEVKFLIDWRQHSTESLFTEELKEWQGPALMVYNNAIFSTEDLNNICKVGSEQKINDLFKTGRFGVGFCATYHLTDLPSFISGKYFTMFDPHTFYLRERISAQNPGIRIDLVDTQADLQFYHDQFEPYNSVFECDVFNLKDDGYQGTLFRFPFRSKTTSEKSKICEEIYERKECIEKLLNDLKDCNELLLFMKHIKNVSVLEVEANSNLSAIKEIISFQRTDSSNERLQLLEASSSLSVSLHEYKTSLSRVDLQVQNGAEKPGISQTWVISSVLQPLSEELQKKPEAKELLNFAEVAVNTDPLKCTPASAYSSTGKVFCFLPLPIQTQLPFHINGFFSITKDRKNVAMDENTSGSMWNVSLIKGPLLQAFTNLLQLICEECDFPHKYLTGNISNSATVHNDRSVEQGNSSEEMVSKGETISDIEMVSTVSENVSTKHEAGCENDKNESETTNCSERKKNFLSCYYSLWNMKEATGPIGLSFAVEFKKCVPTLTCSILWSEINGGCWVSPTQCCVFKDKRLMQEDCEDQTKKQITKDTVSILLHDGNAIVDIPEHVYDILEEALESSDNTREYDYMTFCTNIFFPNIDTIVKDVEVRNRHIKFLVEEVGSNYLEDDWYKSTENFLSKEKRCISCQDSDKLRLACELINPELLLFQKLFDASEGRFPCQELQQSQRAMQGLKRLGMIDSPKMLSIELLQDSAKSLANIRDYKAALKRFKCISQHIDSVYGLRQRDKLELQQLANISFLPVTQKPEHCSIPWKVQEKTFRSPSEAYSFAHRHLVFTQCPVVDVDTASTLCSYLGVSSKEPSIQVVIYNLKHIIKHVKDKTKTVETAQGAVCVRETDTDTVPNKETDTDTVPNKETDTDTVPNKETDTDTVPNKETDTDAVPACETDKETATFLDECMKETYRFLQKHLSSTDKKSIVQELSGVDCVWQDGNFLNPSQVVFNWKHSLPPYMCELSSAYRQQFSKLMTAIGVKKEVSPEMMADILQRIADEYPDKPIPDEVLQFVVYTSGQLSDKLSSIEQQELIIHLPDERQIMRLVTKLADKIDSDWVKCLSVFKELELNEKNYYVHENIPRECAKILGVQPLLEAVVKTMEDKDFLSRTEFGQHEALCDRLNGILKKYPADMSIFKEFIQNADDAQATKIVFVLDHRTDFSDNSLLTHNKQWKSLQHTPALCIYNNRKFKKKDIEGITRLGKGNKSDSPDLIGSYGIGFNVAYHVTDCPSFVSCSENGSPEFLCVFDPTKSFVGSSGRKWNFKDKYQSSDFSDQFQPYNLLHDLSLLSNRNSCFVDKEEYGYVIFRLPLTRFKDLSNGIRSQKLDSGHTFSPGDISKLFEELSLVSQDLLLFLNRIKHVSAYEIRKDKSLKHHFTTIGSIPSQYIQDCELFSESLKQCSQKQQKMREKPDHREAGTCTKKFVHKIDITHTKQDSKPRETKWLIQRIIESDELLYDGSSLGLLPVGGVAAPLTPLPTEHRYLCFCFLPLPFQSYLPVHVNGHFLVDDSRKHLESIRHIKGLSKWNESIAKKVIVPAYIELVKKLPTVENLKFDPKHYYSLFPKEDEKGRTEGSNIGEVRNLNIVRSFYTQLLAENPKILMCEVKTHGTKYEWKSVKECYFCVGFSTKGKNRKISLTPSQEFRETLVALGMSITIAPEYVYKEFSKADASFESEAVIKPRTIIEHMKNSSATNPECEDLLRKGIILFLQYLASAAGYNIDIILFDEVLSLVASKMPETTKSCSIIGCRDIDIVKSLWEYFAKCTQDLTSSKNFIDSIRKKFSSTAIVPASNGKFYPVRMSKALLRDPEASSNCRVLTKLGYPHIDFKRIGITHNNASLVTDALTYSFQKGEEIVECLELKHPHNLGRKLTDDEVLSFVCSLGGTSKNLDKVSKYLLQMPLFRTIDEQTIPMLNVRKVFLLPQSIDILREAIPRPPIGQVQVVMKKSTSEMENEFYKRVIPQSILMDITLQEFYMVYILPNIQQLQEEHIKFHVSYLHSRRKELKKAFDQLKETKFIHLNDTFWQASALYDPKNNFYETFMCHLNLPKAWQDKSGTLEDLGLHSEPTMDEWLDCAKKFSNETDMPNEDQKKKSEVLLRALKDIVDPHKRKSAYLEQFYNTQSACDQKKSDFLKGVATIEFMYSPQDNEVMKAFPKEQTSCMVKFKGSVSSEDADLAWLCKSVLSKDCQEFITLHEGELSVEVHASAETVAENLRRLCKRINAIPVYDRKQLPKSLPSILHKHYDRLSKRTSSTGILRELKIMECILLYYENQPWLRLYKPCRLVLKLPPKCDFSPYRYRVPQSLQNFSTFLTAVGVSQELKAQDYVSILLSIQKAVSNKKDSLLNKIDKIKCAYKELIKCLRQGQTIDTKDALCLPDESLFLISEVSKLYWNDVARYKTRLPSDFLYRKIYPPPLDENGHSTLPDSLGVRKLSEIVVEELQKNYNVSDFACDKGSECEYIVHIHETFNSEEFFHGLCRMYYSENRSPPTDEFKHLLHQLKCVQLYCVRRDLRTVLRIKEEAEHIKGTEHECKCYSSTNVPVYELYIAPHGDKSHENSSLQFYKDLAFVVNRLIKNEIRNMGTLAEIFECPSNEIPRVLNEADVFDCFEGMTIKNKLGTQKPWADLSPQDTLIVLNFDPGEIVCYISKNGLLLYAEIVEGSEDELDSIVILKTKTDGKNVMEEKVPLLLTFKLLDYEQQHFLWSKNDVSMEISSPVVTASIPCETFAELKAWLDNINESVLASCSQLVRSIVNLRLLGHLHFQLTVMEERDSFFDGFGPYIKTVLLRKDSLTTEQAKGFQDLIENIIEKCTSRNASDEQQAVFPSKGIDNIIRAMELSSSRVVETQFDRHARSHSAHRRTSATCTSHSPNQPDGSYTSESPQLSQMVAQDSYQIETSQLIQNETKLPESNAMGQTKADAMKLLPSDDQGITSYNN